MGNKAEDLIFTPYNRRKYIIYIAIVLCIIATIAIYYLINYKFSYADTREKYKVAYQTYNNNKNYRNLKIYIQVSSDAYQRISKKKQNLKLLLDKYFLISYLPTMASKPEAMNNFLLTIKKDAQDININSALYKDYKQYSEEIQSAKNIDNMQKKIKANKLKYQKIDQSIDGQNYEALNRLIQHFNEHQSKMSNINNSIGSYVETFAYYKKKLDSKKHNIKKEIRHIKNKLKNNEPLKNRFYERMISELRHYINGVQNITSKIKNSLPQDISRSLRDKLLSLAKKELSNTIESYQEVKSVKASLENIYNKRGRTDELLAQGYHTLKKLGKSEAVQQYIDVTKKMDSLLSKLNQAL